VVVAAREVVPSEAPTTEAAQVKGEELPRTGSNDTLLAAGIILVGLGVGVEMLTQLARRR
jgi:LPXTG-motif cell wall-anchored protein